VRMLSLLCYRLLTETCLTYKLFSYISSPFNVIQFAFCVLLILMYLLC